MPKQLTLFIHFPAMSPDRGHCGLEADSIIV